MTPLALGSDTGGSIRQPAALCGVVGLKPTYGRVSRYGLIAFASSLDQIGPFARSVADAALALEVISGADPHDSTSADARRAGVRTTRSPATCAACASACRAICSTTGVDAACASAFDESLRRPRGAGRHASGPSSCRTAATRIPVYYLVATAEASSNLARYDGVRYGRARRAAPSRRRHVRSDAQRRLRRRSEAPHHARHVRAERGLLRRVLPEGAAGAHADPARLRAGVRAVDVVATPTSPTPAFRLGERTDDPLQMYLADVFTVSAPLAGLPAISVPCGLTADRLPVGLQLTGRAWDEATLLRGSQGVRATPGPPGARAAACPELTPVAIRASVRAGLCAAASALAQPRR